MLNVKFAIAIQSAKLAGFTIITTASLKHVDFLKSLGANHVIDRHMSTEAVAAEITKVLAGQSLKYSVDTVVNAGTSQMVYDLLAPYGQHLMVLPQADSIQNKTENKKISVVFGWADTEENYETVTVLYEHLTTILEEGVIKVNTSILAFDAPDCSVVSHSQIKWKWFLTG